MDGFLHYLTLPWMLEGLLFTLQLTLYGFGGGLVLGLLLAAMQLTRFAPLTILARTYVVIYRGTPLILQLVFVFSALPHIGISLPPLVAGSVALAMNEATFIAEIIRSGVRGVDHGQVFAGRALGLTPARIMLHVISPQALRTSVPALGSEVIATMKNSALASIIAVPELTLRTQQMASATFDYFEIYFATAVMYLALTGVLSVLQLLLEDALNLDRVHRRSLLAKALPRRAGRRPPTARTVEGASPAEPPLDGAAADGVVNERLIGEPVIELDAVRKSYGDNEVLSGVSLTVRSGEVVALLGPSGSGKSTLLRTINALEEIDGGAVRLEGTRMGYRENGTRMPEREIAVQRRERGVGMVFQHFNLFAHLSAVENVAGPLRWAGTDDRESAAARAAALLAQVGLSARADALPARLSGGQQQRVGIARALAGRPRILLLDEPTSALDPELVAEVLQVIRSLAHSQGLTMIIATHQLRFASEVADRVVVMAGGRIVEEGPAREVIGSPREPLTQRFVAAMGAGEL
ncbi:amino acid ABC transporter permease/ATP-binding protein [Microbacterium tumbae]